MQAMALARGGVAQTLLGRASGAGGRPHEERAIIAGVITIMSAAVPSGIVKCIETSLDVSPFETVSPQSSARPLNKYQPVASTVAS